MVKTLKRMAVFVIMGLCILLVHCVLLREPFNSRAAAVIIGTCIGSPAGVLTGAVMIYAGYKIKSKRKERGMAEPKRYYNNLKETLLKPGERLWACGLKLNTNCTSFARFMEPTEVEICCGVSATGEADMRKAGKPARTIVPVKDGRLVWQRVTGPVYLLFTDTEAKAVELFYALAAEEIGTHVKHAKELEEGLSETRDKLAWVLAGFSKTRLP